MDVIQSLKSVFDGKRRRKSGDSAYNSENETEDQLSDASSTPEQRRKQTRTRRSAQQPLKTREASQLVNAASGSASTTPKSPCNIDKLLIKISAQGLNGPKAMRIDASTEDENSYTLKFDGRSRGSPRADETTHLWIVPPYDKTKIRTPAGGWIMEIWLKDPSTKDDSDGSPAGESPAEPPSKESPQTPVEMLRHIFEGLGRSEDEIDGTGIDPNQYPLRLVRMNSIVSVVHKDDQSDVYSSMWALENHNDDYHTLREPSRFKKSQDETDNTKYLTVDRNTHEVVFATQEQNSFAKMETKDLTVTKDPSPQVTDTTRYLAIDDDTKKPFLVRAGEYHKCLITPEKRLVVTNAAVYT